MNYDRKNFQSEKEEAEYFRAIQGHLSEMLENYQNHLKKAIENLDTGFSRSFEETVKTSCKGLCQTFLAFIERQFSTEVAVYYNMMIFQNLFADLIDNEILMKNELTESEAAEAVSMIETLLKVKIEPGEEKIQEDMIRWIVDMYERPSFNKFYYGYACPIYSSTWILSHYDSVAYHIIPHQQLKTTWDMHTKMLVAEHLEENIEACCEIIISDIHERRFNQLLEEIESGEIDVEGVQFSEIYENMRFEMDDIDKKLIANDEPARFLLPQYGV